MDAPPSDSSKRARRKRRAPGTITIREIAALSAVSTATVTRALQGDPRVRPETRERVEQAVAESGYRPNHMARALATGASHTIGMLLPSIGDRFWSEVVAGVEDRAEEAGFALLLATSHGETSRSRRMLDVLLAKRVDGMVVAARHEVEAALALAPLRLPITRIGPDAELDAADIDQAERLAPARLPAWLKRHGLDHPPEGVTAFDDFDAARTAVKHLVELGHKRLAFVGAGTRRSAVLRVAGFRHAAHTLGADVVTIVSSADSLEDSRRTSEMTLGQTEPPTAVVAYDDMVAIGVIRAAHAVGLRVPDTLSVVGVDDIDVAAYLEPPLTTVRQPKRELGRLGVDALLATLSGGAVPAARMLRGELVLRGSTASPHP